MRSVHRGQPGVGAAASAVDAGIIAATKKYASFLKLRVSLSPICADVKSSESWAAQPLPRGRHKLPAEEVHASQRARLIRAALELVGTQGYEATTVPQIVATARVSSGAFYQHFADKAGCFLAACDEQLVALVGALPDEGEPSPETLREGVRRYLRWWSDRPVFTRAYFVELPAVGSRATEQRERGYAVFRATFAALARRVRADHPKLAPLTDVELSAAVFAPTEIVAERVRAGRTDSLPDLEDDLYMLLLRLLTDDHFARRGSF